MSEQTKNSDQDEVAFGFNLLASHLVKLGEKLDKLVELAEAARVPQMWTKEYEESLDMQEAARKGAKPKDLIRQFKISQKRAEELVEKYGERRAPERVEVEAAEKAVKDAEVTIEMVRETAAQYMKTFGTADLLDLNLKFGGAKKLSEVEPKSLGVLYREMKARIDREGKPAEPKTTKAEPKATKAEPKITLDIVKAAAKKFMDEHGEKALAKLIHAHGGKRLSEVPEAKLPALYEALSNA